MAKLYHLGRIAMKSLQPLNTLWMFLFFILTCYFVVSCQNAYAANNKAGTAVNSGTNGDLKTDGKATNKFIARIEGILKKLKTTKYVHTKDSCINEPAGMYQYDCSGFIGIFAINEILPEYCTALNKGQRCVRKYNCGNNINSTTKRPLASDFYNYFETMETNDKYFSPVDDFKDVQKGDIIAIKYADEWRKKAKKYCNIYKTRKPSTGHVLIAWSSPRKSDKNCKNCCKDKKYKTSRCTKHDEYYIKVVDSADSGHRKDTRNTCKSKEKNCPYIDNKHKGIGVGVMYFGVNDKGKPIYYRWSNWDSCKYSNYDCKDCDSHTTCNDYICKNGSPDKKGISKWNKIDGILVGRFKDEGMDEH